MRKTLSYVIVGLSWLIAGCADLHHFDRLSVVSKNPKNTFIQAINSADEMTRGRYHGVYLLRDDNQKRYITRDELSSIQYAEAPLGSSITTVNGSQPFGVISRDKKGLFIDYSGRRIDWQGRYFHKLLDVIDNQARDLDSLRDPRHPAYLPQTEMLFPTSF